jgi:MYXO-CTERM domain-containing protein
MRQVPDVALSAAAGTPGYVIICTFSGEDCSATAGVEEGTVIGGTSASSPSFAGVVAIMNQAAGTRLGNINPLLYTLDATITGAALPFHDITSGNNEIVCGDAGAGDAGGPGAAGWPANVGCAANGLYGYPATTGYDCASGLGSIDGFNLVSAAVALAHTTTALAAAPIETTEGGIVTLTATVDTVGASAVALGGEVTFTFESYTTTGEVDLSWELGTVSLAADSTSTTGQAVLKTAIPPGLVKPTDQWVDVVAAYSGDAAHLPSVSPKVGVGFSKITFAVTPATAMLQPGGSQTFSTTGGVPPVRWFVDTDTTRGRTDAGAFGAASIDETTGALTVGEKAGYVEIVALDSDGAEALAEITVGDPTTPAPWSADGGVVYLDSGVPPLVDAGHDAGPKDAGVKDAAHRDDALPPPARDAGVKEEDAGVPEAGASGCSCELAGGPQSTGPVGALGGLLLGLALVVRRRRS